MELRSFRSKYFLHEFEGYVNHATFSLAAERRSTGHLAHH